MKHHGYVLHHVVPIEWGGTNKISNLVALTDNAHQLIHTYIREANRPLRYGESRYVTIPVFNVKILTL